MGTVYAAELGISLFSEINRYTLSDALVEMFYHLKISDSTACSVTLAQSREYIEALQNGSENLSIYSDNDIETYRDVLFYVGQVLVRKQR